MRKNSRTFGKLSRTLYGPLLALAALSAPACAPDRDAPRLAAGHLWEKAGYQTFHGADGRIERLLQDRNGDGRAETVVLYDRSGKPRRAEIDTNDDGVVDRWEEFHADGSLASVGYSVHTRGRPDLWEHAGADGRVSRREIDDNGDGTPDRTETAP